MQLGVADWIGLIACLALMSWVAWVTRRSPRFYDFALASKRLPAFLLFASLAATYIGPGFSMGAADKGSTTGFYTYFLFLPFALQTLMVGLFLAPRLACMNNCASIGDVMGVKYNRFTHLLTGISSVAICTMFTAYLAKVGGSMLELTTGLPFLYGVIVVTAISVSYCLFGGLRATVLTEAVQFVIFTSIIPLVAIFAFFNAGFDSQTASLNVLEGTKSAWQNDSWINGVAVALSFLLGETLIPPYANRALAAPTPRDSTSAFVWAGVFCVLWLAVVTGIGIAAMQLAPDAAAKEATLLDVSRNVLPPGLFGVMIVAVISIILSSQDSVLNAGAVSVTRDIFAPFIKLPEEKQLLLSRLFTVLMGIAGAIFAGWLPTIIEALLLIYSIWAPTVLVPFVLGLLIPNPGRHAAWPAILAGGAISILWQSAWNNPGSVPAIFPGLGASLLAFAIGHFYSKKATGPVVQPVGE